MKINDAFYGIKKVFLDTAPVVYYVEGTTGFANATLLNDIHSPLSEDFRY